MDNITIVNNYSEMASYNIKDLKQVIVNGETVYERKPHTYDIIAIVGPSGCGKTTLINKLLKSEKIFKKYHILTFSTSRPKRSNESDEVYYFYSKEDFEDMINHQNIVQCSVFNDWYYGLEKSELSEEYVNIGIFSPKAIGDLMQNYGKLFNIKVIYLKVSDKVRLMRSLQREENPDVNEIIRRFSADAEDFIDILKGNPIILINETEDDLRKCENKIEAIAHGINIGEDI